jgi:seryl-tRNA synthetase
MLDIKFIRENPSLVQSAAKSKGIAINVDYILKIDQSYRTLSQEVQKLREERNSLNEMIKKNPNQWDKEGAQSLKQKLEKKEDALRAEEDQLNTLLLGVPNVTKPDVKIGKDESENEVIKTVGKPSSLDFKPRDHLELGEKLDIIDTKSAAKVSGARFAYLKNEGVFLELALIQFAFEILVGEGFTPIFPPVLIKKEITDELGYWHRGGNEDYFWVHSGENDQGYYLIGTAEHAIVPMFKDYTFASRELPKRIVAFSSAFRREAGSYGKDTRGILRVHQFDKVEMVSIVREGEDDKEQDYLLSLEEKFFKELEIPYQIVKMCTGDTGFVQARKVDLEAWIPSQQKYREMTSASTVTDFQSRRLNIKYLDTAGSSMPGQAMPGEATPGKANEKKFAFILNATALAIGRTLIAILENHQQKDGSVVIPKALHKYLTFTKISSK